MIRFHNSMRWRLQLWYGLILVAVLAAFGVTAYQLERHRQFRAVDDELDRRVGALGGVLRPPNRPGEGPSQRRERPPPHLEQEGFGPERRPPGSGPDNFRLPPRHEHLFVDDDRPFYFVVWRRDGAELARSPHAPPTVPQPMEAEPSAPPVKRLRGTLRESMHATPPGELLLVGRNIAPELAELRRTGWWLGGVGSAVLLLGLAGGWWIASRAIRPIADISSTARKITAGDLSQRINSADTASELGELAAVLNSTFARLDGAFAQQARFTSDAAHELRTPVTVMLTQTQSVLARERGAAEYRVTIEACQRAAQRMRRLTESLLALARMDAAQPPNRTRADISETVHDAIESVTAIAVERGIAIDFSSEPPSITCDMDSEQITQVVINLLTNALRHSSRGSSIAVALRADHAVAVLTVTDTGSGIGGEDLPRIFERFYRADKSRTDGHAGLGLAIVKSIVEAHAGTIDVTSRPNEGSTFTVRLPIVSTST